MQFFHESAVVGGVFRSIRFERACAAALALLPVVALAADGSADTEPPAHIPTTVVTATLIPTPTSHLGSSVAVITAAEIDRHQWRTLPQALRSIPGLNVVQTGGSGGSTSVFLRGTNSNQTKVIIDGIAVNDPSKNGIFNFGGILTADISRIEVLRGPQSSLYGSDAIGGVINIITKKGAGPVSIALRLEGGSLETFNQMVTVNGATDRYQFAFTAAHYYAGETPVTPLNLLPPGRARIGDRYENTTLSIRLGADLTKTSGVDFVARYADTDLDFTAADYSVFPSVPAAKQTEQGDQQLFAGTNAYFSLFDGHFNNRFGIGYTRYRTRVQSPETAFGPSPATFSRGTRVTYDWQGDWFLAPGQTAVFGLEHRVDGIDGSPISADNSNSAAFAELQSQFNERLYFAVSVRRDHNERFGGQSTWRIAPTYTVNSTGTQLKASYGTGFKAPSLTQLFVSFPAFNFFANPNLEPEESAGYDVGFEQPLSNDRIRFGATWFHNDIKNLIVTNATGTSLSNAGRVTTHGIESFVSYSTANKLSLSANYTYTIAEDEATGNQLLRRPKHTASINASWLPTAKLNLSATVLYVGSWVDGNRNFTVPRLKASSYSLTNIAAHYRFAHGIALFGRIDNVFDRSYESPVGFLHPGRGVFIGVRTEFGG